MDEYTQVDQSWIDKYIDGFETIGITFYDKDKHPTNLYYKNIYKTQYKDNHPSEGGHTSYPGSPLFIKNDDYENLQFYIMEQLIKHEDESDINSVEQYIKDAKRKEDEEDNIRKNIEQINMELIFGSNHREHNLYQNNLINNENIEIKRIDIKRFDDEYIIPKEFDTYTIKIKTPHIIFHYDFITQQFSLSKMLIDTEYNMKNINDRLIIATKPILYGSMLLYDRGLDVKESLFYIYKVDANPEFDSVEKALKPILKYYDNKGRPWYESSLLQQESNVAPNIQNVAQNVEQRQTSCFGRACETFRRYARINPRGGKRTRKQKKTRKHKKAHRKIIHKKK